MTKFTSHGKKDIVMLFDEGLLTEIHYYSDNHSWYFAMVVDSENNLKNRYIVDDKGNKHPFCQELFNKHFTHLRVKENQETKKLKLNNVMSNR